MMRKKIPTILKPMLMSIIVVLLLSFAFIDGTRMAPCAFYCFVSPAQKETFDVNSYRNLSCTHFVYGFSRIRSDMSLYGVTSRDNMEILNPGNLRRFLGFRSTHPNLHTSPRSTFV
ncbi:hypothetical protein KIN20_006662 [Parelaphostrongylus tenuis]|uniref:Secreted protein n=1 Tax=Parelaphostrongylus tenuis TaxID=148309 RepID=A0AAD5QL86_PARTN|nr:hypothetical protein KIN20_006662 [Parelaphostrongylus tenuis]